MAKSTLLFVSVSNSDILTFINIKINKNNIETAPTYTIKYTKPKKCKPMVIRYTDIEKNNPIKNNTDNIGFLLTIIYILKNTAIKERAYK